MELTDQQVNCMEKSVEEGDRFKEKNIKNQKNASKLSHKTQTKFEDRERKIASSTLSTRNNANFYSLRSRLNCAVPLRLLEMEIYPTRTFFS